jgi:hypothetical protein
VQIVAEKTDAHSVARMENIAFVRNPILVQVLEQQQIGNVGEVNTASASEHARGDPILDAMVTFGENGRLVRFAVTVGIEHEAKAFGFAGVVGDAVALVLFHHGDAIRDRSVGEIVVEPVHVTADVGHAGMQPIGFGDVEAALMIDAESNGIGEKRFGGDQLDLETFGHSEALDRGFALVRGCGNARGIESAGNELGSGQREGRKNKKGPKRGRTTDDVLHFQ